MTDVPKWLERHLIETGRWDADRVTRKAGVRRCPDCKRRTYIGLDADLAAGVAVACVTPLSRLGEAAALVLGLHTYSLRWTLTHLQLDIRDHWTITGHPAATPRRPGGTPAFDVVAQHSCEILWLPSAESIYADHRRPDYSGDPPY